jgi:hypothetical protein
MALDRGAAMSVPRAAPSRTTPWLLAGTLCLMTAWAFPYFTELGSPNELTRLYLARALIDDGRLTIDGPVARRGPLTDMARRDGRLYSDKAPGVGLLGAPCYAVLKLFAGWRAEALDDATVLRWLRLWLAGVPTALTAWLLFGLLGRLGLGRRRRFALVWAWGAGSVAFAYGSLLYGHALCGLWLVLGLAGGLRLTHRDRPDWVPLGTGAALGAALLTEYTSLLLVLPLALVALVLSRRRGRDLLLGSAGALLPLGLLALYHQLCFGAPWATGYAHLVNRHYAQVHAEGLLGLTAPSFERLGIILFSPTRGLLFYSPWLLLAPVGLVAAAWRPTAGRPAAPRPVWLALAAGSLLYLLFAMALKLDAWGWSLGPRHLTPLLPFWTLACGVLLARSDRWGAMAVWTLRLLAPYAVIAVVVPTAVFGGFPPDFSNPLADFIRPLLLAGCVGPNLGAALGLVPIWGLLPLLAAALVLAGWLAIAGLARGWQRALAVVAAAGLVLAAYGVGGPPSAAEQRALGWARGQVLGCPAQQPLSAGPPGGS